MTASKFSDTQKVLILKRGTKLPTSSAASRCGRPDLARRDTESYGRAIDKFAEGAASSDGSRNGGTGKQNRGTRERGTPPSCTLTRRSSSRPTT